MEKKFKFLFLDFEIPYLLKDTQNLIGGACVRVHAFSKGLTELGHKVGFLTWKGANTFVNSKSELELVETYSVNGGIRKLRWFYLRFPLLLLRTKSFNPDFVICKSPSSSLGIMAIICLFLRVKLVFMLTNDIVADNRFKKRQNKINQVLYSFGLQFSHAIFCQNQYQYNLFKKEIPNKSVFKITNPYYNDSDFDTSGSSSKIRFPWDLPGGLVAVLLGTALWWIIVGHYASPLTVDWGVYLPQPAFSDIFIVFKEGYVALYLSIIIPMGIFNVIGSLQNIESAEAGGDRYPTRPSLLVNGIGTLIGAGLGSCFPTTIYIGHPGWKAMGARVGYSVINGFFVILENQVRVGDVAIVNGTGGLVEAISFRTITLRDLSGTRMLLALYVCHDCPYQR